MSDQSAHPVIRALIDKLDALMEPVLAQGNKSRGLELGEVAWVAATAHNRWAPIVNAEEVALHRFAAADHGNELSVHLQDNRSRFTITREKGLGRDDEGVLRFQAHSAHIADYAGRRIDISIGGESFCLGVIDEHGMASVTIPAETDFSRPIHVRFGALPGK